MLASQAALVNFGNMLARHSSVRCLASRQSYRPPACLEVANNTEHTNSGAVTVPISHRTDALNVLNAI